MFFFVNLLGLVVFLGIRVLAPRTRTGGRLRVQARERHPLERGYR